MRVCKTYLKIIWRKRTELLIYLFVFAGMGIGFSAASQNTLVTDFENTRTPIAFFTPKGEENSALTLGLKEYLDAFVDFVDLPDEKQPIADALFARRVEYVLRVPEGFEERFFAGEEGTLARTSVPDSYTSQYVDAQVEQYLNTVRVYRDSAPGMDRAEALASAREDLTFRTPVSFGQAKVESNREEMVGVLLNMMSYSTMAILILGVCSAMLSLQRKDVHMRNLASPLRFRSYHMQLVVGNLLLAGIVWLAQMAVAFALFGDVMTGPSGFLLSVNGLLMCLVGLSISYFFAGLVKSRTAMSGAANVVSLGMGFISGAFVPQALISPGVLKVASFLPAYWFIKGNGDILALPDMSLQSLGTVLPGMLILVGYAIAILGVTLVLNKHRRA